MNNAIEINQVHKKFGDLTAVNQLSFNVQEGEFFGLLGPNGAGKTTLIGMMAGLTHADSGTIHVMGHEVKKQPHITKRNIGVVPQEIAFDPFFSVRETLTWQSGYFGLRNNQAWIDELLHHLGLTDKADANMRSLSGGMKRRVMVAQAIVHRPPVIVLDEPTAGVDVELRRSLWSFIQGLHQKGHTIVLTTHYLEEAEQLCQRIAMVKKGELVALDQTHRLLSQAAGLTLVIDTHSDVNPQTWPQELQQLLVNKNNEGGLNQTDPKQMSARHQLSFQLEGPQDLEPLLAQLRQVQCPILNMTVNPADLEDIFLQLMKK